MSTNANISIKNLPQTLQVEDGDFLIVEKTDGTYILDYADFILESEKTAITSQVDTNTTAIAELSTNTATSISDLSAQVYGDMKRTYIGKATVSIDSGVQATAFLSPRPTSDVPQLDAGDFIITPANAAACKYAGYITSVETSDDGVGYFTIASNITQTTHTLTLTGAASTIVTTITSTLASSTAFNTINVGQLIASLSASNTATDLSNINFTVLSQTVDSTVEQTLEYPQYNIFVMKTY